MLAKCYFGFSWVVALVRWRLFKGSRRSASMGADHSSLGVGLEWMEAAQPSVQNSAAECIVVSEKRGTLTARSTLAPIGQNIFAQQTAAQRAASTGKSNTTICTVAEITVCEPCEQHREQMGRPPMTPPISRVSAKQRPHIDVDAGEGAELATALARLRTESINSAAAATAAAAAVAAGMNLSDVAAMKLLQARAALLVVHYT
jgi:hypothetical protein